MIEHDHNDTLTILGFKIVLGWLISGGIVAFATMLQPVLSCLVLLLTAIWTAYNIISKYKKERKK